jgi:hypothetical protein
MPLLDEERRADLMVGPGILHCRFSAVDAVGIRNGKFLLQCSFIQLGFEEKKTKKNLAGDGVPCWLVQE